MPLGPPPPPAPPLDPGLQRLLSSYSGLRIAIGLTGLVMPWVVRLLGFLVEGIRVNGTISAYYYTGMRDLFVGTLVLVGVLLAFYSTPRWWDNVLAVVAGVAAICIGVFPVAPTFPANITDRYTTPLEALPAGYPAIYFPHGALGLHGLAVGVFFLLGFWLVWRSFTETAKPPAPGAPHHTWQKLIRNQLYRASALVMLGSGGVIALLQWLHLRSPSQGWNDLIFFPESLAVSAFAFAWLVKGQLILKDGPADSAAARALERTRLLALLAVPLALFLAGWYLTARG